MMINCPECNRGHGKWMELTRDTWLKNVEMTVMTRNPMAYGAFHDGPNYVREYTCVREVCRDTMEPRMQGCDKTVRVYLNKCENCYEFCDSLTPDAEGYLSCDDCHIEDAIEAEDEEDDAHE